MLLCYITLSSSRKTKASSRRSTAQKNYVLDAPLGDRPIAGADADVMNVWLAQYDDYLIV